MPVTWYSFELLSMCVTCVLSFAIFILYYCLNKIYFCYSSVLVWFWFCSLLSNYPYHYSGHDCLD